MKSEKTRFMEKYRQHKHDAKQDGIGMKQTLKYLHEVWGIRKFHQIDALTAFSLLENAHDSTDEEQYWGDKLAFNEYSKLRGLNWVWDDITPKQFDEHPLVKEYTARFCSSGSRPNNFGEYFAAVCLQMMKTTKNTGVAHHQVAIAMSERAMQHLFDCYINHHLQPRQAAKEIKLVLKGHRLEDL